MANIKKLSKTEYVPKQILLAEDVKTHAEKTNEVIDVVNTNTASINTTLNKLNDIIESNRVITDKQAELNQKVVSIDASITDINDIIENLEIKDYDASIENIYSHIQLTDSSIIAIESKIANISKPAIYYGTNDIASDEEIYDKNGNIIDAKEGDIYICIPKDGDYLKGKTYIRFKLRNTLCWASMTGNINAENVYFPEGIVRDVAFGSHSAPASEVTECKGKNLKELLEYYTTQDKFPDNIILEIVENASAPVWDISYDSSYPLITDLNITHQDENGDTKTAKSEEYYEVGTVFTIPSQSYKTKPILPKNITVKDNIGTQQFMIGPSSLRRMTYGFWIKNSSNNYTAENLINKQNIVFDANTAARLNTINTQVQCTATYEYIDDSDAQINYKVRGAVDMNNTTTKYTPINDIITTKDSSFTLKDGDATITMQVQNKCQWKRTLSNSVPQSSTIVVATKHKNYQLDGSIMEEYVRAKSVGRTETKGAPYPSLKDIWTFTAHGVYPSFRYVANDETAIKWQWRKMTLRNHTKEDYKSIIFSKSLANLTEDNATLHTLQLQIPELYITKDDGNLAAIEYSEDGTTWQAINDIDYGHHISTQNPITGETLPINYVVFIFAGNFTLDTLFRFKF